MGFRLILSLDASEIAPRGATWPTKLQAMQARARKSMPHTSISAPKTLHDWPTIVALNVISTVAQVAQFGIPFVVLPVWFALHGANTAQLGLYSSALWLGQLPGLGLAPWMSRRFGAKWVILLALLCTGIAYAALAYQSPFAWLVAGVMAGFGQGLRWIGLESWLYRIAPRHAQGRLIGLHETLIALAPILAPVLAALVGLQGSASLYLGLGFLLAAALPLLWIGEEQELESSSNVPELASTIGWMDRAREPVFLLGVSIALIGGMSEAAFLGMFPVFGQEFHLDVNQIAGLLSAFGVGGVLFQYVAGWLADHRGLRFTCLACCVSTSLLGVSLTTELSPVFLYAAILSLGGTVTAYLTLALIASSQARLGALARNMSLISMAYTASATTGPVVGGYAVEHFGGVGLMWVLAAPPAALTLAILWLTRRPHPALPVA